MWIRILFAFLCALSTGASLAKTYVVANRTCFGPAPLQPPTTNLLAQRTFRVLGADSSSITVRRRPCGDGTSALYATSTAFDSYFGAWGGFSAIQNGVAYTLRFSSDPLGCSDLGACGSPLGYTLLVIGFPQTTMITSVFNGLETGPAFDDEQAFTLSLTGGFPSENSTHPIPASGSTGGSLPPSRTISDNLTGTWWNPQRGGEGFTFDVGTISGSRYLFFTWYTYVDGRGVFLSGSALLPATSVSSLNVPLYLTRGARFGNDFVPGQVITDAAGTATIERLSCGQVRLAYAGQLGAFTTQTIVPLWTHDFGASCQ